MKKAIHFNQSFFHFFFFTAASVKVGKVNVTAASPGLFACEQVVFADPFNSGQDIKVLVSFGHSVKSPSRGNGAAIWVELEGRYGFRACISEFGDGSNGTAEVNWIAIQSVPFGTQKGNHSIEFLDHWN